VLNPNKL